MSANEAIAGIPGSATEMHGAAYALTEEFVSVYRLHPLLPDTMDFYDVQSGRHPRSPCR